jgi:formate dehydrogenase major subunit
MSWTDMLRRLAAWPVLRQISGGGDGTGPEAMSTRTQALRARTEQADGRYRSVCPYCAVGCGQLVHTRGGRVQAIEGDPESPISGGHLCPKGAASYELVTSPLRETGVRYRAPHAREWSDMSLDEAMDRIAERVWTSRRATWNERLRRTTAVVHLGGATLDIEENYLIKKLFSGGLGMVCLSNQARI